MPWNDPFEELVEKNAEQLGAYLASQGDRPPHVIARTQEIYRDFCQFLCKDAAKATKQDYTVYCQLHAMTPQDEADYQQMLADIQSFCEQSENLDAQPIKSQYKPRNNIATCLFSPPEHLVSSLLATDNPESLNDITSLGERSRLQDPQHPRAGKSHPMRFSRDAIDAITNQDKRNAETPAPPNASFQENNINARLSSRARAAVPTRITSNGFDAVAPAPTSPATVSPSKKRPRSISEQFDQYDFSLDRKLADEVRHATPHSPSIDIKVSSVDMRIPTSSEHANHIQNTGAVSLSGLFPAIDSDDNEPISKFSIDDSIAQQVANCDLSEALLKKGAIPENNELLRGISGVDYDFSQNTIGSMRKNERARYAAESSPAPVDEDLLIGFRPFLIDDKYLIDCPAPIPQNYTPYKAPFISRIFFPLVPFFILTATAFFTLTLSPLAAIPVFIAALAALAIAIPDIRSPLQQTPQATLNAFLRARYGRCYATASALIALEKGVKSEIDFSAIWQNDCIPWPKAILSRFARQRMPATRTVLSAETQNAVVLLCTVNGAYYVVPLVRLNDAWFITNPDFQKRSVDSAAT